jgi:hypothetical protein
MPADFAWSRAMSGSSRYSATTATIASPALPAAAGRAVLDAQDPSRFHLRARQHQHQHLGNRGLRGAARRVPGLRPHHAGLPASRGLAARYVSGYLRTSPPGTDAALLGADASHAWVSVFCPPFGWIDLDPTNDVRVATDHIVIAWGRDFGDVSPLRGVIIGGGRHRLSVRVSVQAE